MSTAPELHSIPSDGSIAPPWGTHRPSGGRFIWIKLGQSTPLGKGSLRRTWVKQLRKSSSLVDMELAGAKLRLHLGDNRSEIKALQQSDRFMQDERDVIRGATAGQGDEPVYIVDIGANAGLFTAMAGAELTERAHVLAVEPNPVLLARLTDNSTLSQAARIEVAAVAIGGNEGELELAYHDDDLGGASMAKGQLQGDLRHIRVPVKTLASLLDTVGFPRVDIMKIDVEGFEDQALLPFFETTDPALWPKVILMEIAHQARWSVPLVNLLKTAGYRAEKDDGSADIQLYLDSPGPWPGQGANG